jgi:hypothetical protein
LPGIARAGIARAISDAALPDFRATRALVTAAVQRKLVTPEALRVELARSPRNGSGFLRRALQDVVGGAKSIAEAEAVALLRRRRDIPPFEVNALIRNRAGRVVAEADVLWRDLRAVLEIDSREFHFGEDDWKRTTARHNLLTRLGYTVVHYQPSVIRRAPRAWVDEVAEWLAGVRRRAT